METETITLETIGQAYIAEYLAKQKLDATWARFEAGKCTHGAYYKAQQAHDTARTERNRLVGAFAAIRGNVAIIGYPSAA